MKGQSERKYLQVTHKVLISKIYKQLIQFLKKKKKQLKNEQKI